MEVSLEKTSVSFGGTPALRDVSFRVEPGERMAVIGASGAGKSTLFRTLTRSVPLSSGSVEIGDRNLYELPKKELKGVRRNIGTIYQAYNLVPQLPAGVNVALGEIGGMGRAGALRTFLTGPGASLTHRVRDALEEVGLGEYATARTANLSGGQQQRVAVARLLVQRPSVVLADEPFAAVDPVTTEKVLEALNSLNEGGATLLVNLHDVEIARRFPRIVALREGRVAYDGPSAGLTEEKLAEIYKGDPQGAEERSESPQYPDPTRVTEGRDGVAAH
ncbi:MAG: ATP-binding cassette domain-containing protein [Actinomycetota bacterium]|nr:ATP-binding cassette domain-containing protein [Actinomycetota bacterium]